MASLRQLKDDPSFELHTSGPLWFGDKPASTANATPGFDMPTYVPEKPGGAASRTALGGPQRWGDIKAGGGFGGGPVMAGTGGGKTTTTTREPTMPKPTMPAVPAFKAPEWDEAAIRKAAQRKAAPRLRSLRRQMEREAGRQYENPNVKRMTLRQAMEGYGLGLGSITSQAEAAGRAEYGEKYSKEFAGAQTTYQAQTQALMQSYQNAFSAYIASMQQTTTTGPSEGTTELGTQKPGMGATGFTVPPGKDVYGRGV